MSEAFGVGSVETLLDDGFFKSHMLHAVEKAGARQNMHGLSRTALDIQLGGSLPGLFIEHAKLGVHSRLCLSRYYALDIPVGRSNLILCCLLRLRARRVSPIVHNWDRHLLAHYSFFGLLFLVEIILCAIRCSVAPRVLSLVERANLDDQLAGVTKHYLRLT